MAQMKSFIVVLCGVCCLSVANQENFELGSKQIFEFLDNSNTIWPQYKRCENGGYDNMPNLPDTMDLPFTSFNLTTGNFYSAIVIEGLSTLTDCVQMDFDNVEIVDGTLNMTTLSISGIYYVDGTVMESISGDMIHLIGNGQLNISIEHFVISAIEIHEFFIDTIRDRIRIGDISGNIDLWNIQTHFENLQVNGELVDWDLINLDPLPWFQNVVENHKEGIFLIVEAILNRILDDYSFMQDLYPLEP